VFDTPAGLSALKLRLLRDPCRLVRQVKQFVG